MSRMFACAGLGVTLTLAASALAIFAHVGQINGSLVPRNIRMVDVNLSGLGAATGAGSALYGTGPRTAPNSGLRQHYEWGLWTYCGHDTLGGSPDYCSGTQWANEFQPVSAILADVPTQFQTQVANALPSGSTFASGGYLGRFSKGAFYVLFVGAAAGGLALITGFLAHRIAFLLAAMLTFFAFLCEAVGCIIWTVIIHKAKSNVLPGISVGFGDGLWLYWASTGCLFFAGLPFLIGCIVGRDRY